MFTIIWLRPIGLKLYTDDKPIIKWRRAVVTHERSKGAVFVAGKIARALLGSCGSAVRDLVHHVGCDIEHASILFSKTVSRITFVLFYRAGNMQYYIVLGFAIHEHITA